MIAVPLAAHVLVAALNQAAPLAVAVLHDPAARGHRGVTPASAMSNALAAYAVETPALPASMLVAIALHESGMSGTSSPRGHWEVDGPVPHRRVLICGLLQVTYEVKPERRAAAPTAAEREDAWRRCRDGMDVFASYRDAVADRDGLQSLGRWARICRDRYHARNVTACAVSAHARGGRAGRAGDSELWRYVVVVSARLRRAVERVEAKRAEVVAW